MVAFQVPGVADLVAQRTILATATGGAGRTDIWTVGIRIFESAPVTGVGYANFPVAYTPELVGDGPRARARLRAPHNIVVGTLGELGLIGLACLVLFLAPLTLRRGWGPDAAVVQAILASLMVSALFLDVLGDRKQVWITIGLATGLAYLARQGRASTGRPGGSLEMHPRRHAAALRPAEVPGERVRPAVGRRRPVTDVVWLTGGYPWDGDTVGGIFFQTQARALARLGLSVTVVSPTPAVPWPLSRVRARWRLYSRAPRAAQDGAVTVVRPRYPNVPGQPSWALPDRFVARAAWRSRREWAGAR